MYVPLVALSTEVWNLHIADTTYQVLTGSCKQIANKPGDCCISLPVYCRVQYTAKVLHYIRYLFFSFRLKLSETSYPIVMIESLSKTVIYLFGFVVLNCG